MIKSDEAIIESARVNLGYTNLTSPIDGVTGIRQIDIGNIIYPTDVNGLVDVTQIEPISLIFTLPEADFVPHPRDAFLRDRSPSSSTVKTASSSIKARLTSSITRSSRPPVSIRLRAQFPNKKHLLWPGSLSTRGCSSIRGMTA